MRSGTSRASNSKKPGETPPVPTTTRGGASIPVLIMELQLAGPTGASTWTQLGAPNIGTVTRLDEETRVHVALGQAGLAGDGEMLLLDGV